MKSVQQSAVVIRVDRNDISCITCNEKYILVSWCGFKIPSLFGFSASCSLQLLAEIKYTGSILVSLQV